MGWQPRHSTSLAQPGERRVRGEGLTGGEAGTAVPQGASAQPRRPGRWWWGAEAAATRLAPPTGKRRATLTLADRPGAAAGRLVGHRGEGPTRPARGSVITPTTCPPHAPHRTPTPAPLWAPGTTRRQLLLSLRLGRTRPSPP